MIPLILTYAALALGTLVALAVMILQIGTLMAECPEKQRAVQVTALTITTGFAAIGAGGVILIGALLPVLNGSGFALLIALGLAALCLGLGFTQAIATLRAVLDDLPKPPPADV